MLEILVISGAIVGGSFTLYKLRKMERPAWWPVWPRSSLTWPSWSSQTPYKTCTISFVSPQGGSSDHRSGSQGGSSDHRSGSQKCTPWVDRVYHTEEEYLYDETELTKISLNSDQNELFRLCGYTGIKVTDQTGQDILEVNFKEKRE